MVKAISILVFLLAICASPALAQVQVYDYPSLLRNTADFGVSVRQGDGKWLEVPVAPVKVNRVVEGRHNAEVASMAWFDFDGAPVEVRVTSYAGAVDSVRVRPMAAGIRPQVADSVLTFTIDRPVNISVETNGDIFHNLHLFANPIDKNRPTPNQIKKDKNLIYFCSGIHRLEGDTLKVASNAVVYIDGGARVVGTILVDGADNVKIFGRGVVAPESRGYGVEIKKSHDVEVDGIIVTQILVGESDGVNISNVKSISSYGWGDGMNVFASSNVTYDRVFCRNSDDCHTVYATRLGHVGSCHNILMRNSVLWADVAHPITIGLHGNAEGNDSITNCRYENIDIVDHCENQIDYQGCLTINCGDNNMVENVTFDNVRIEDFRKGQLFNVRICFNKKYCAAPGAGIKNIRFKDITYNGSGDNLSIIAGYDQNHKIENIYFENLTINGRKITDDMPGKPGFYKTSDFANMFVGEHVENITFK